LLAQTVCTELCEVTFALSAQNSAGKSENNSGLQVPVRPVNKMSRLLQPSVLLNDGTEKVFYKEVPQTEGGIEKEGLRFHLKK
jgi:hypothetical protein